MQTVIEHFQKQAEGTHNSPLMECLLEWAAGNLEAGGIVADIVSDYTGDPFSDALTLRFAGGLHFLVLSGKAPELEKFYPSTGGTFDQDKLPVALAKTATQHKDFLKIYLDHQVQTNEVLRSAPLMAGFLELDKRLGGVPFHIREMGASGGLNQIWDQYNYQIGETLWSPLGTSANPTLTLEATWKGDKLPPIEQHPVIASRRGCDIHPMDLENETARLRLMGYVWPDQIIRLQRLKNAIETARAIGVHVEQNDAASFVREQLVQWQEGSEGNLREGALVFYHSVFWVYVPKEDQNEIIRILEEAGAKATPQKPLAWLRMEAKDDPTGEYHIKLSLWNGGPPPPVEGETLAITHPHGTKIEWL